MRKRMMAALGAAVLCIGSAQAAGPDRIDVFLVAGMTVSTTPADRQGIPVQVHRIDAVDRTLEQLSDGLAAEEALAEQQARERLNAAAQQEIREAYEPLVLAKRLGLEQVPAVVMDREAVVYGTTDLDRALREFEGRD